MKLHLFACFVVISSLTQIQNISANIKMDTNEALKDPRTSALIVLGTLTGTLGLYLIKESAEKDLSTDDYKDIDTWAIPSDKQPKILRAQLKRFSATLSGFFLCVAGGIIILNSPRLVANC